MKNIAYLFSAAALLLGAAGADAKVALPQVLSDGMVVQRGEPVRLWGTADPGESVTAKSNAKKAKAVTVTADSAGRWTLELPALKAGGPYTITINDLTLSDVLSGDVFLCSGQSNMELPVRRVTDMFADEIAAYSNPQIREYKVPQTTAFHGPQSDTPATAWRECAQPAVMEFSALGYFFAKALNEATGVPVGIVNASWGGRPAVARGLATLPRKKYTRATATASASSVSKARTTHTGMPCCMPPTPAGRPTCSGAMPRSTTAIGPRSTCWKAPGDRTPPPAPTSTARTGCAVM